MVHRETSSLDNRRSPNEIVGPVLDFALGHPQISFIAITKRFELGAGTLNYWLNPTIKGKDRKSMSIHPEVLRWMKDHGPEWIEARPRNTLNPKVLAVANKAIKARSRVVSSIEDETGDVSVYFGDLEPSTPSILETDKPENTEVFQPGSSGDLVVLEKEVEGMLDRAVATVNHLESILTSIKITVKWTAEIEGRLAAERKVRELENQVSLADKVAKEAQTQMLSNKMIDKFGSR